MSNMVWNNNTYAEVVGTNQVDKSNKENRKNEINKKLIPAFSCSKEFLQSENISLGLGKSVVLPLSEPIVNRTLGNPGVVHAMLVSSNTMYLVGLDIGTTNMIMQGKSGQCKTLEITVGIDPSALQEKYNKLHYLNEKLFKLCSEFESSLTDALAENLEQARLLGMGSEREARLMAMLDEANHKKIFSILGLPYKKLEDPNAEYDITLSYRLVWN
jgi:ABC-type uncharacterized transport system permease subunit